jgi:hypothetical protein
MTKANLGNSVDNIQIVDNVLSEEEHTQLLEYVNGIESWHRQPWGVKFFLSKDMPEEIVDSLEKIFRIAYQKCTDLYDVNLRVFERHEVHLIKFEKNYKIDGHVDTTGDFAVIYYINDDYAGGEISFPNHNLKIKPKPNSFVAFPSNQDYYHEVLENVGKERYSSTLWFNFEGSPYRGNINQYNGLKGMQP